MSEIQKLTLQLSIAVSALRDVKNWNDDREYEWGDSANRASDALDEIENLEND